MALTASAGPQVTYGITVSSSGATGEYNDSRGPTLNDLGSGLMDPRTQYGYGYNPGQPPQTQVYGFWGQTAIVDFTPNAASSNNIVLSTGQPVAGTALVLTASGVSTTLVSCIIAPETGKLAGNLICIDTPCGGSSAATVAFGQSSAIGIWNPASVCGRCLTVSFSSNLDTGFLTVAGRDAYGFKVTESVALTSVSTVYVTQKAFKYISAIMPCTTITSTGIMIGVSDTYGFPMLVQHSAYAQIWIGAASSATLVTTNVGNHVFGSSLATSISTGPDVRGTYKSSLVSGSSMRVVMIISPEVAPDHVAPSSFAGLNMTSPTNFYNLFGATQFSSV